MICNQICQYNTLDGCKKDKYNADCPISNTVPSAQDWANVDATEICKAMSTKHDKSEWISVEERLPPPFISVLVHMPGERPLPTVHEGYITGNGKWYAAHFPREADEITHWMPLPEPPKEVE